MRKMIVFLTILTILLISGCSGSRNNPIQVTKNDNPIPIQIAENHPYLIKGLTATDTDNRVAEITGLSVDYILELRSRGYGWEIIIKLDWVADQTGYDIEYILALSYDKFIKEDIKVIKNYLKLSEVFAPILREKRYPGKWNNYVKKIFKDLKKERWETLGQALSSTGFTLVTEEPTYPSK